MVVSLNSRLERNKEEEEEEPHLPWRYRSTLGLSVIEKKQRFGSQRLVLGCRDSGSTAGRLTMVVSDGGYES